MNHAIPIQIRGIFPTKSGAALFLGNEEKVFVVQVDPSMAAVIDMFLRHVPKERPLTHDLIKSFFRGFGITVERVVLTEMRNSTFYARILLKQQSELGTKLVEVDARPSDCLALATAEGRPIYVAESLFKDVEDMSELLEQIKESRDGNE